MFGIIHWKVILILSLTWSILIIVYILLLLPILYLILQEIIISRNVFIAT